MTSVAGGYLKRALRNGRRPARTILRAPLEVRATLLRRKATGRGNAKDRFVATAGVARANSVDAGRRCPLPDQMRGRLAGELSGADPVRSFVLERPT